ncbi:MAG: hypothetical protein JJT94_13560 [Bernardetiaceae bacterium]|nr:hypothetical protein [Bernardetiaceae bacterium]
MLFYYLSKKSLADSVHKVLRWVSFLLALHILNFSLDVSDSLFYGQPLQHQIQTEDTSINEIESVMEFVLECVLDIEDAIPEHDEGDNQNPLKTLTVVYWFVNNFEPLSLSLFQDWSLRKALQIPHYLLSLLNGISDVPYTPPKQC